MAFKDISYSVIGGIIFLLLDLILIVIVNTPLACINSLDSGVCGMGQLILTLFLILGLIPSFFIGFAIGKLFSNKKIKKKNK